MKIYEWTYQGRTGTLTADNTKDAKAMLVGILRGSSANSSRVPKGTTIKKIGLCKSKKTAPVETFNEDDAVQHTPSMANTVYDFTTLANDCSFTNCTIRYPDGAFAYVSDHVLLNLPKGTVCCAVPL